MTLDARLRRFAPFAIPLAVLAAGWLGLVRPSDAARARTERQLEAMRPRLDALRMSLSEAPPPEVAIQPASVFERQVTTGDPGRVLEELSRLAPRDRYRNLSIDASGEQGAVAPAAGPQVAGADLDPRLALFPTRLTYVPVRMAFDADYQAAGELLWRMRDLATLVEIRSLQIGPASPSAPDGSATAGLEMSAPGHVHVVIELYAFARPGAVAVAAIDGSAAGGHQ
jgi:hypothetical protein